MSTPAIHPSLRPLFLGTRTIGVVIALLGHDSFMSAAQVTDNVFVELSSARTTMFAMIEMKSVLRFAAGFLLATLVACAHKPETAGEGYGNFEYADSDKELMNAAEVTEEEALKDFSDAEIYAEFSDGTPADRVVADGGMDSNSPTLETLALNEAHVLGDLASDADSLMDSSNDVAPVVRIQLAQSSTGVKKPAKSTSTPKKTESHLNRYYLVRAGDTAEYVSNLIYGKPDHAAVLQVWNGSSRHWVPGKLLYYSSPVAPADRKVISFYSERKVPSREYVAKPGDSLQIVADRLLGHPGSAREIALANGLGETPLKVGQKLKIYLSPLSGDEKARQPEVTVATRAPAKEASPQPAPKVVEVAAIKPPVTQEVTLAPKAPKEKSPKLASAGISSFLQHNPLLIACTTVVVFLIASYLYMQRKRYRKYDF